MAEELQGQVALVTGGSRGIGRGIARALAEAGAAVAVIGRNADRARAVAEELPGAGHGAFPCDVADADQAKEAVAAVADALGPVTVLVNNAGIARDNILARMKDEEWDEVMAVNLKGAFNMTRALTRPMMKQRDGVVINVSSVVGLIGNPGQSNYAASKAGIIGFTRSVARELAPRNIRCNAIAPGYIETDMTKALDAKQTEALEQRIPLGRLGTPEDVAGVARFLASPAARYITGQVLAVDGGMVT